MIPSNRWMPALLALGLAATAVAAPVVRPGSPSGPSQFTGADGPFAATCSGPVSTCLSFSGSGSDPLEAAAVTLIPVGTARNQTFGRVSRFNDFTVEAAPDGVPSTVPARVSTRVHVKGGLAAFMEGVAGVDVQLVLLDITGGVASAKPVASRTIFEDEVAGSFQASMGASPGVLLPVPDAEVSVDFGVSGEARKKLVDQVVVAEIEALVQRGRTYRIEIQMVASAQIGTGGGLAHASFVDTDRSLDPAFKRLPDLVDPGLWLDTLEPLVRLPSLDLGNAQFASSFTIPGVNEEVFPGFDWGSVKLPGLFGSDITIDMSVPSKRLRIDPMTVNLPAPGGFNNFTQLLSDMGLPNIGDGATAFAKVAEWLDNQDALQEILIGDGGLSVQQVSLVLGDDSRSGVLAARDAVMARDDANRTQVMAQADANRAQVMAQADANRDAVMAGDDANRVQIMAHADANLDVVRSAVAGARAAIINNDDANHDAEIAHADAARDAILARSDENTQRLLDAVAALHEDAERREIHSLLGSGRCEPWMYAPAIPGVAGAPDTGGSLDLTLEVVGQVIADAEMVGTASSRDVAEAGEDLAEAEALAAQPLPWSARTAQDLCRLLQHAWQKVAASGSN